MPDVEVNIAVSARGVVSGRRDDGADWQSGQLGLHGLDAELIRMFERWLAERDREWQLADLRAFGGLLHRALFPPDLWRWVEESIDALPRGGRLRLQLAFPADALAHLAAIPWEFLYAPDGGREGFFLATDRRCVLTRYIPMELGRPLKTATERARVLVLVSQPDDPTLGEVVAEPVLADLEAAADAGVPIELKVQQQPTCDLLDEVVARFRPDVVHFMGHGACTTTTKSRGGSHWWTKPGGRTGSVRARCPAAGRRGRHPRLGTAFLLRSADWVPGKFCQHRAAADPAWHYCVVAMQYAVTNRTAIAFSKGFYRGLTSALPLDESVQSGGAAWPCCRRRIHVCSASRGLPADPGLRCCCRRVPTRRVTHGYRLRIPGRGGRPRDPGWLKPRGWRTGVWPGGNRQ
jgi:hypothetical protein